MLEELFKKLGAVPPVPPEEKLAEPLQATNIKVVPPVPPVPPEKTKVEVKNEINSALQEEQKVLNWLASIGETDPEIIEDTLKRCREDSEALAYFLRRADTDDLNDKKVSVQVNDDSIPILGQTECYDQFDDWEE